MLSISLFVLYIFITTITAWIYLYVKHFIKLSVERLSLKDYLFIVVLYYIASMNIRETIITWTNIWILFYFIKIVNYLSFVIKFLCNHVYPSFSSIILYYIILYVSSHFGIESIIIMHKHLTKKLYNITTWQASRLAMTAREPMSTLM